MKQISVLEKRWMQKFARNLVEVMEFRGISITELAYQSGLSRMTIYRYMNAERDPKLYHARILADVLGVTIEDLAG